ncbi:hypothetical protein O181_067565 [Austropuccinia psidii MF-1]|uniref:Uncharacterized protein n=1 Tax=Austropuccinia psidii MF-1 TaxID=1389203 RepID=A0A9Q3ER04_9BASI|nr:hypothetical protein [Austropuccinia psidii MF-1]
MLQKMVCMRIIKQFEGEMKHALRSRCIEPFSTGEYIHALEEMMTRPNIGRKWKKLVNKSPNKPFIKQDKPREPFKPNKTTTNEKRKWYKSGGIRHSATNCLTKAKINEIVGTEYHNNKEDESDSEKDT